MRDNDQILLENIYTREILNEKRKERLLPMFNKIIQKLVDLEDGFPYQYEESSMKWEFNDDKKLSDEEYKKEVKRFNTDFLTGDIQQLIKDISVIVKKENLVVILLKDFLKLMERDWKGMFDHGVAFEGERDKEGDLISGSREWYQGYFDIYKRRAQSIEHWFSLPIPELQEYLRTVSPNEEWNTVHSNADTMEREWQNRNKNWLDVTDEINKGSIEEFIKFDNNMAWYNLHRPYCQDEGSAMGHCGNKASFNHSDTVLSLRETKKEKNNIVLSKPHLTFILKSGQFLGEMKGRANSKPQEKYHPYIMELLLHKQNGKYMISGIEGGGYAPERNFDLEDLSDQLLKQLADERPTLIADKADEYIKRSKQFSNKLKNAINSSSKKRDIIQEIRYRSELSSTKVNKVSIKDNLNIIYEPKFNPNYPLEA